MQRKPLTKFNRDLIFLSREGRDLGVAFQAPPGPRCVGSWATRAASACRVQRRRGRGGGNGGTMPIESVVPFNHLLLCLPLLLLPSIFPSLKVFSNELVLCIRWPKYWSFSFSISPSNEYSGLISFGLTGWISLLSKEIGRAHV